jgi:hypothetical protein
MHTTDPADITSVELDRSDCPFVIPWPQPGNLAAVLTFHQFSEWQAFVTARGLHPAIPQIVRDKYRRAQRLYLFAWIDADLVKAGELVALTALELALKDRYGALFCHRYARAGAKSKPRAPSLHQLLEHLVIGEGLTDAELPFIGRYGGSIIPVLLKDPTVSQSSVDAGNPRLTLAEIRNSLAHGEPFDGFAWSGLLELVRDLIEYAYRAYLQEYQSSTNGI